MQVRKIIEDFEKLQIELTKLIVELCNKNALPPIEYEGELNIINSVYIKDNCLHVYYYNKFLSIPLEVLECEAVKSQWVEELKRYHAKTLSIVSSEWREYIRLTDKFGDLYKYKNEDN